MTGRAVISCILGSVGAIAFIVMVAGNTGGGCLSIILCLILLGGYIGGNVGIGMDSGAAGVALFNLVGIVLGIIGIKKVLGWESSSSSNYSSSSSSHSLDGGDYKPSYEVWVQEKEGSSPNKELEDDVKRLVDKMYDND